MAENIDIASLAIEVSADSQNASVNIDKLVESLNKLKVGNLSSFCTSLDNLTASLNSLNTACTGLPNVVKKAAASTTSLSSAEGKSSKSTAELETSFSSLKKSVEQLFLINSITSYLKNATTAFNDYYESANYFSVAMGDASEEATGFIDKMEELLGIDPMQSMNAMANYKTIATSFGLTSDNAYALSKNLTQLAYDYASLKNLDPSETITKFNSALAGELEPVLQLGIDISQARLQQELLTLGYDKQVSSLSQADKAVLRYIAIMKQSTIAQGDFARTISSPANQLRVLQSELTQLARSVGSLLYPALKSILPVLIAAVELIQEFVSAIAALFGQKIEFPDFSQTTSTLGGVTDALDDTTDATKAAAKAAKDYTMGFDELNIIEPETDTSSGSSGSSGSTGNLLGDVDLSQYGYDMFADYIGNQVDSIKRKIENLLPIIGTVAAAFATWKVTEFLGELVKVLNNLNLIQKAALMAVTLVVEWTFVQKNADEFLKTGDTFALIKEWLVTGAATIAGSLLFGAKGATLTLAISAIAQLNSLNYALENATVGTVDKQYWIQLISASVTGGLAGLVLTHSATGFVVTASLTAALELMQTAYLESKNGTLEIGGVMNQILAGLAGAATGTAGVAIALAAGASVPVAGAVLVATFGLGVVLEQVGVSMGSYDRIEEIRQYIADYESKGYNELAITMRLKNLGYSDEEIELAENEATTQFDIFKYDMGELIGGVIESINDYWENESLLHGAIEQAEIGAAQLKESIDTICDNFIGWCSNIQENAAEAGRATAEWFNSVKDKAAEKVVEVKEKVEEGFSNAASAISAKYSELKESVTTWAAGIKDGLADKAESVKEKASEIASSIKTKFSELSLVETAQNIIQTLITGISNLIENVKTKAGEVATAVKDKIAELSLVETAKNIIQTLIDGIGNLIESVKTKVGEVTDGIKSTFEGLSLFDIGKNLIQGLINGIGSLANDVTETVCGLADSVVNNFKRVLGIHSPSTVMAEAGGYIVEGLSNGITESVKVASKAAYNLATITITAFKDGFNSGNSEIYSAGEQAGEQFDQGVADGVAAAKSTVDAAWKELVGIAQNTGNSFADKGVELGTNFVDNLDKTLTSKWSELDSNLQSDFFGTIKNLYSAAQSGDVETVGTTIAAVIWQAMGDEQRTQIKTVAKNMITDLGSQFKDALGVLSDQAYQIGSEIFSGITSQFGNILTSAKNLGSTLSSTFSALKAPLKSVATAISTALSGGLSSSFPTIFASMGTLISTIGASFVSLLEAIGAALDATVFGIPMGVVVAAAGVALAATIAGIVGSLGGSSSTSTSGSGSTSGTSLTGDASGTGNIDYSKVAGTSQYNSANASTTSSYASSSVQQLSTSEIKEAVYNGAYNALLDYKQRYANENSNNTFKLYIDGKQITASVEKTQNERGRSIMGTEAYSY